MTWSTGLSKFCPLIIAWNVNEKWDSSNYTGNYTIPTFFSESGHVCPSFKLQNYKKFKPVIAVF